MKAVRTALIKDGVVTAVVMAPADYVAPAGEIVVASDTANIGDSYANGAFASNVALLSKSEVLVSYANAKQSKVASGGFTVNVNTSGKALNVSVATDASHLAHLSSVVHLAQMMVGGATPEKPINWVQDSGVVSLTAQQVVTLGASVMSLVQDSFTVLGEVLAAITAGKITKTTQIETPPSPIPAWPVNS